MKIGELSRQTGVSIDAIRFYEKKGLLPGVGRTDSGYRSYEPEAVAQLRFLKSAQSLGFSLQEILDMMPALTQGSMQLMDLKQRMQEKIDKIDARIAHLMTLRDEVVETMRRFQCDASTVLRPKDLVRRG